MVSQLGNIFIVTPYLVFTFKVVSWTLVILLKSFHRFGNTFNPLVRARIPILLRSPHYYSIPPYKAEFK